MLTRIPASKLPAKARAINIKSTVASFTSLAYEQGIVPAALDRLVDLVTTPNYLDQASLGAVIRNLYPAERPSPDVALRVVSALGHGALKASLTLQAALLKWLVMVYHVLETPAVLAQAYSVLFNLLDTAAIRYVYNEIMWPRLCETDRVKPAAGAFVGNDYEEETCAAV